MAITEGLHDVYCVSTTGVPFSSTSQCTWLLGSQVVQLCFLILSMRRILRVTSSLATATVLASRKRAMLYAQTLLSSSATIVSVVMLFIGFPLHSTAAIVISSAIVSTAWWFYTVALVLGATRSTAPSTALPLLVTCLAFAELIQLSIFASTAAIDSGIHVIIALQHARAALAAAVAIIAVCVPISSAPVVHTKTATPFDRASFLSRVSYNWIAPFIRLGKQRRVEIDDVPDLPADDATTPAARRFQQALDDELRTQNASFLRMLRRLYGREVALFALWSTANKVIGLASPLLIKLFLDWAEQRPSPNLAMGYTLAFAMALRSLLASVSGTQYSLAWKRFDLRVRAGLIAAIYDRTMRISASSTQHVGVIGHMTNLISVDVGRLVGMPGTLFDLFLIPIEIVFSLVLLAHEVRYAFVGGMLVLACMLPIQTVLGGKIQSVTKKMLGFRDQRVEKTAESLKAMRTIKLLAWVDVYFDKINGYRQLEMYQLTLRKYLDAFCVFFWASTPVIVQTSVFVIVVYTGHDLSAANAFTAVSLLDRLIYPLNYFPWIINGFLEARVSALRLRAYLFPSDDQAEENFIAPALLPPLMTKEREAMAAAKKKQNNVEADECVCMWSTHRGDSDDDGDASTEATVPLISGDERPRFKLLLGTLRLAPDTVHVVCGSVGSGKSSLLLALLGEMPRESGRLARQRPRAAYAPQNPWLFRGTVRDNVTMLATNSLEKFDRELYDKVLRVCALELDLRTRPAYDLTVVSEDGTNFSGGQKLRINLARALYQRASLYLLDDPLSGLDVTTARSVVRNCFLEGVFPEGATVVVVTHAIQLIEEFPKDVHVIVMEDGAIAEQGSYTALMDDAHATGRLRSMLQSVRVSTGMNATQSSDVGDTDSESKEAAAKEGATESPDVDGEEQRESGVVRTDVWVRYASAIGWPLSIMILLSVAVMQTSRNGLDLWIADYTNDPIHRVSPHKFADILLWITLVNCVAVFFRAFLFAFGGLQAAKSIYCDLATKIFQAPLQFFSKTPVGRILNRLSGDTYSVDESLPFILNIFLKDFADVVGTLVIIFYGNKFVLLLLVPLSIIYFRLQSNYRPLSRHMQRLESTTQSPILSMFTETLDGLRVIRALKLQPQYCGAYVRVLNVNQRMSFLAANAGSWFGIRLDLLGVCVTSFVAVFAVVDFQLRGTVHPGVLGLTLTYALPIVSKLNTILGSFVDTERQMIAVERVKEYTDLPTEDEYHGSAASTLLIPPSWPTSGEVTVKNLSVVYDGESGASVQALKHVNCTFTAGEKIGICGRTGAGKSTFMLALFRAVPWQRGSLIMMDGVAIDQVPIQFLRARLTYVPQDVVLFAGTVRSNLDPDGSVPDNELWACLARCGLDIAVARLDGGLDALVASGEITFSRGQAQLLCIARALLRRSKVLCIDEATSSIDYETERVITKTLEEDFAESTVIIIAHRLKTISECDRVFLFDQGSIVETGPPKELLADTTSRFSTLANEGQQEEGVQFQWLV